MQQTNHGMLFNHWGNSGGVRTGLSVKEEEINLVYIFGCWIGHLGNQKTFVKLNVHRVEDINISAGARL
jgi:hypothetical protein